MSLTTVLLVLLVGFFLWGSVQTQSAQSVREHIERWQPMLTGMRWALIGVFALGWPYICHWLARSGRVSDDNARELTGLRWRIVGWLVVIELILGQRVLVELMAIMAGNPA